MTAVGNGKARGTWKTRKFVIAREEKKTLGRFKTNRNCRGHVYKGDASEQMHPNQMRQRKHRQDK